MPTSITFFYHKPDSVKPTMTIALDGTVTEHGLPFLRRLHSDVALENRTVGPTRAQLDAVKSISAFAVQANPYCVLTYKCLTSPWALDQYAKNKYLAGTLGPPLPRARRFKPKPVKKPSEVIFSHRREQRK